MKYSTFLSCFAPRNTKQQRARFFKKIASQINDAFKEANASHVTLLLETMAGQGNTVGSTFEQLATIIAGIQQKKKIGVCVDTCHLFASGYKFDTSATYKNLWKNFDAIIGLEKLKAIHINDSKKIAVRALIVMNI